MDRGGRDQPETRPGDWTCPGCNANVFASKYECFKCRTPKPDGFASAGYGGGGGGGGYERSGGWQQQMDRGQGGGYGDRNQQREPQRQVNTEP